MFRALHKLYKNRNRIKISIDRLNITTKYEYDDFNHVINGNMICKFYDCDKKIGYLSFRPHNGQIGIIVLEPEYRGNGLGNDIVEMARRERATKYNKTDLFAVTSKEHPFWKNYPGAVWTEPADASITGDGYRF